MIHECIYCQFQFSRLRNPKCVVKMKKHIEVIGVASVNQGQDTVVVMVKWKEGGEIFDAKLNIVY